MPMLSKTQARPEVSENNLGRKWGALGAGEMIQGYRAYTDLAGELSSVPSTHTR